MKRFNSILFQMKDWDMVHVFELTDVKSVGVLWRMDEWTSVDSQQMKKIRN
jgi:hypothetical protein